MFDFNPCQWRLAADSALRHHSDFEKRSGPAYPLYQSALNGLSKKTFLICSALISLRPWLTPCAERTFRTGTPSLSKTCGCSRTAFRSYSFSFRASLRLRRMLQEIWQSPPSGTGIPGRATTSIPRQLTSMATIHFRAHSFSVTGKTCSRI